jgi:hypothetical protein
MDVGGFDERYFATWEEIDFGAKLCMNGYKSIGLSEPVIYHQGGASFSDPINQHPAMLRQSLAQTQWIEKWSLILNVPRTTSKDSDIIRDISIALINRIPNYKLEEFATPTFDSAGLNLSTVTAHEDIHGWFDWEGIYKEAVSKTSRGTFVEVGSWMGKSACFMGECIKSSGKKIDLHCVDIWDDSYTVDNSVLASEKQKSGVSSLFGLFNYNMSRYGVNGYITTHKTTSVLASAEFADSSLDMVFLDGAHDYESVKKDLECWYPKLKSGAIFAGHDYFWSHDGVQVAVDEFFAHQNRSFKTIGQCWYIRK